MNKFPELKQYLKQCAFVRWGSAGFLNKLRFFLPEPAFLTFQRNVTLRTLQPPPPSVSMMPNKSPSLMQVRDASKSGLHDLVTQFDWQISLTHG